MASDSKFCFLKNIKMKRVCAQHNITFMFAFTYTSRLLLHYISIRFCFCNSWAWYRHNHYRLSQEILTSSLTQTHINLATQKQSCFLHMHWIWECVDKLMWIIVCLFTIHCLLNDAFQQYPFSTHKHDKTQQAQTFCFTSILTLNDKYIFIFSLHVQKSPENAYVRKAGLKKYSWLCIEKKKKNMN